MRKLASLAAVIVGLLFVGQAIGMLSLPISVALFAAQGSLRFHRTSLFVAAFVPALLALAAGTLLVLRRQRLAERWFDDAPLDLSLDGVSVLRLGLILSGIALLTQNVIGVARSFISIIQVAGMGFPGGARAAFASQASGLIGPFAGFLLGAILLVWSRPLASRLWSGRSPQVQPQTSFACPVCQAPYNPDDYRPGAARTCSECGAPLDGGA